MAFLLRENLQNFKGSILLSMEVWYDFWNLTFLLLRCIFTPLGAIASLNPKSSSIHKHSIKPSPPNTQCSTSTHGHVTQRIFIHTLKDQKRYLLNSCSKFACLCFVFFLLYGSRALEIRDYYIHKIFVLIKSIQRGHFMPTQPQSLTRECLKNWICGLKITKVF